MKKIQQSPITGKQFTAMIGGILLIVIGLMWIPLNINIFRLWWWNDEYVDAELEVIKYHRIVDAVPHTRDRRGNRPSRTSSSPSVIEGIIHPGHIHVETNDRDVTVTVFETPDSMVGEKPLREELEGKRLPIMYRPDQLGARSWWQPPAVLSPERIQVKDLAIHGTICVSLFAFGIWCIGYANRRNTGSLVPSGPGDWPEWTGIMLIMTIIAWCMWCILFTVLTKGYDVNRTATARIPWTPGDWALAMMYLAIFTMIPATLTWIVSLAVRQRYFGKVLTKRS